MISFNKNINNDIYEFSSNDSYDVKIDKNYTLVRFDKTRKDLSNSLLGSDIGIKSRGFINIAVMSSFIAVATFIILILSFRV